MEERRPGPLGYSVEAPEGHSAFERALTWGVAAAFATAVVGVVAAYFLLNVVPSQPALARGWALAVPVAAYAVAVPLARSASPGRWRRALAVVGAASLPLLLAAHETVDSMRPTFPQLESVLAGSALPAGYAPVREQKLGDRLCRDTCPRLAVFVRAPSGAADPVRDIVTSLYRHGWSPRDSNIPAERNTAARRGRFVADFAPLPGGLVRVTITAPDG